MSGPFVVLVPAASAEPAVETGRYPPNLDEIDRDRDIDRRVVAGLTIRYHS
jgi:hypothetical protein